MRMHVRLPPFLATMWLPASASGPASVTSAVHDGFDVDFDADVDWPSDTQSSVSGGAGPTGGHGSTPFAAPAGTSPVWPMSSGLVYHGVLCVVRGLH